MLGNPRRQGRCRGINVVAKACTRAVIPQEATSVEQRTSRSRSANSQEPVGYGPTSKRQSRPGEAIYSAKRLNTQVTCIVFFLPNLNASR